MNLKIDLTESSIDAAIQQLQSYQDSLEEKAKLICEKLASRGAVSASLAYARGSTAYTGPVDCEVTVEPEGDGYKILANGETVLFLEFGAGVTYGGGHPLNGQFGMGPGTYPGQTHAMTGKGWYLPKSRGGGHTYGNPPTMAMYNAAQDIRQEIQRVAEEVFRS